MTDSPDARDEPQHLLELFLTGYWSQRTRANYVFIVSGWFAWCDRAGVQPCRDRCVPQIVVPYATSTVR